MRSPGLDVPSCFCSSSSSQFSRRAGSALADVTVGAGTSRKNDYEAGIGGPEEQTNPPKRLGTSAMTLGSHLPVGAHAREVSTACAGILVDETGPRARSYYNPRGRGGTRGARWGQCRR